MLQAKSKGFTGWWIIKPLLQWSVHFVWQGFPQEITSLIPDCFSKTKAQGIPQFQRGGLHLEVVRNVTKKRGSKIRFCFKSNKFGTFRICVLWIVFTSLIPNIRDCIHHAAPCPKLFDIIADPIKPTCPVWYLPASIPFTCHTCWACQTGSLRQAGLGLGFACALHAMNPCEDQLWSPRSEEIWVKRNLTRIHLGCDGFSSVSLVNQGYLRLVFDTLTDSTNSKGWKMRWARETSVTSGLVVTPEGWTSHTLRATKLKRTIPFDYPHQNPCRWGLWQRFRKVLKSLAMIGLHHPHCRREPPAERFILCCAYTIFDWICYSSVLNMLVSWSQVLCTPQHSIWSMLFVGCIQASQGLLPFTGRCHPRVSNLPGYLLGQQGRPCRHGWRCRRARRFRRVWLCLPLEPRHRGRLLRGICEGGWFLPSDGVRGTLFGQLCYEKFAICGFDASLWHHLVFDTYESTRRELGVSLQPLKPPHPSCHEGYRDGRPKYQGKCHLHKCSKCMSGIPSWSKDGRPPPWALEKVSSNWCQLWVVSCFRS